MISGFFYGELGELYFKYYRLPLVLKTLEFVDSNNNLTPIWHQDDLLLQESPVIYIASSLSHTHTHILQNYLVRRRTDI